MRRARTLHRKEVKKRQKGILVFRLEWGDDRGKYVFQGETVAALTSGDVALAWWAADRVREDGERKVG